MSARLCVAVTISLGLAAMANAVSSQAAGYSLLEQGASGLGNAFAGGAAAAEDASSIYANPAGMTYLPDRQLVTVLHGVRVSSRFDNDGTIPAFGRPLGNEGGDAGGFVAVPNIYYSHRVHPDLNLGIAINAPFGLKTDYDKQWMGRYQAVKSEIRTLNINPSLAYKVNDSFSVGFGISLMKKEAELTRVVNFGPAGDGFAQLKGDDWGFGYNLGAIWQARHDTRFGVSYRSRVRQHIEGDAEFTRPALIPAALAPNGNITTQLTLPESASLSVFHQASDRLALMADMTWTGWNRLQDLTIKRENGTVLVNIPENWHDTMRYSVGASYQLTSAWKLRGGLAYDQESIKDRFRTVSIPGDDRTWVTLGASYRLSEKNVIDIAYAHLFVKDTSIDNDQGLVNARLRGDYHNKIDVLSVQYTHNF
jgi:long-chain fatty acid transport protein